MQISKWTPADLPVSGAVLPQSQKKRGLGHIYWVPNDMQTDWHEDAKYICHKMVATKEVAQKLCECTEASCAVPIESSEKPQMKKGKKGEE